MSKVARVVLGLGMGLVVASGAAMADGDAAKGEKVFAKCKTCHDATQEKNKVGPYLVGIFGRKAGSVEGFNYSDAMKNSGIVWDHETLAKYVHDPKAMVPGNKMVFPGLKKDDEIEDLLAYLKQATAH